MTENTQPSHHIILVGLPGAGKTSVGKRLAARIDRMFVDFDREIERMFGYPVSEIFTRDGEPAFRTAEIQISQRFAAVPEEQAVLAPGGGWIANQPAVAHLRPVGRIIYLRVAPSAALRRIGAGRQTRPMFATGNPKATMERLWHHRKHLYEDLADLVIDTTGKTLDTITSQIVERLPTIWHDTSSTT